MTDPAILPMAVLYEPEKTPPPRALRPMATLSLPDVYCNAPIPIAVFSLPALEPVLPIAYEPIAVLRIPVLFPASADAPTAVLLSAVVSDLSACQTTAVLFIAAVVIL